jgi:hypothetical protein
MDNYERSKLADGFKDEKFKDGEFVIKEVRLDYIRATQEMYSISLPKELLLPQRP